MPENCTASGKVPYTFGIDYQVDEDVLVYAKTSRGFRSGGQNLRGGAAGPESFAPFDPETVTDLEIGLKSQFFNDRV